jgi:hypothetical protein
MTFMAGPLAIPTFRSRPDDNLAAVDVYSKSDSAVVNNIKDVLASPVNANGLLNSLRGGNSALATLTAKTSIATAVTKGLSTDSTSAMARLGLTGAAKALSALTPALTQIVSTKLAGGNLSNLKATVANAAGKVASIGVGSIGNLSSVNNTVNSWTGQSTGISVQDNAATAALASTLVTTGLQNGSTGVLTSLQSKLTNPQVMQAVIKDVLPTVNKSGSISGLREINTVAPGALNSISSNPIADFSCAYPAPAFPLSTSDYQQNFSDMKSTFADINPGWTTSTKVVDNGFDANGIPLTKAESVFDMSSFTNATPEFKKTLTIGALSSSDPKDKLFLVASNYSGNNPESKAANMYPAAFVNSEANNATSADPRSVALNDALQQKEASVNQGSGARAPASIQKEMDWTMDQWTLELKGVTDATRKAAIDAKWSARYDNLRVEYAAVMTAISKITIT